VSIRVASRSCVALATAQHTPTTWYEPRIVPASFEFSLASLKPDARSSGTSIRLDSSAGRLNSAINWRGLNRIAAGSCAKAAASGVPGRVYPNPHQPS